MGGLLLEDVGARVTLGEKCFTGARLIPTAAADLNYQGCFQGL